MIDHLGATGKFPEGQLREDDEGEIAVGVTTRDGKVLIEFGKEISWFAMTPVQAVTLATILSHYAREISGEDPQ